MIFNHLEINYDSWWHHAKESITKVMLSFLTHPRWRGNSAKFDLFRRFNTTFFTLTQ